MKSLTERTITYTEEFRETFYLAYQSGKGPSQILREMGFDTSALGNERIKSIAKRMRKYAQREDGFIDQRQHSSGRPRTKGLTIEEQLERANHKIALLKQENDFLKKSEFLERRAQWSSQRQSKNSN